MARGGGVLEGDALLAALRSQVEFYFSHSNPRPAVRPVPAPLALEGAAKLKVDQDEIDPEHRRINKYARIECL